MTSKSLTVTERRETDLQTATRHMIETANCRTSECFAEVEATVGLGDAKLYLAQDVGAVGINHVSYERRPRVPSFSERIGKDGVDRSVFPWDLSNDEAPVRGLQRVLEQVYRKGAKRAQRHTNSPETTTVTNVVQSSSSTTSSTSTTSVPKSEGLNCTMQPREKFSFNFSEKHAFCSRYGFDHCLISEKYVLLKESKFVCVYEREFTPESEEEQFFDVRCREGSCTYCIHENQPC